MQLNSLLSNTTPSPSQSTVEYEYPNNALSSPPTSPKYSMPGDDDDYRPSSTGILSAITNSASASSPLPTPRPTRARLAAFPKQHSATVSLTIASPPMYPHLLPLPAALLRADGEMPALLAGEDPSTSSRPPPPPTTKSKKASFVFNVISWLHEHPEHEAAHWSSTGEHLLISNTETFLESFNASKGHSLHSPMSLKFCLETFGFRRVIPDNAMPDDVKAEIQIWEHFLLTQASSTEEAALIKGNYRLKAMRDQAFSLHKPVNPPVHLADVALAVNAKQLAGQIGIADAPQTTQCPSELQIASEGIVTGDLSRILPSKKVVKLVQRVPKKYSKGKAAIKTKQGKERATFASSFHKYTKSTVASNRAITRIASQQVGMDVDTLRHIVSGPTSPVQYSLLALDGPFSRTSYKSAATLFEDTGSPLSSVAGSPRSPHHIYMPMEDNCRELSEDLEHSIDLEHNLDLERCQLAQELYDLYTPSPEYYRGSADVSWPTSIDRHYPISPLRSASTSVSSDWPSSEDSFDVSRAGSVVPAWASELPNMDWFTSFAEPCHTLDGNPPVQDIWEAIDQIMNSELSPSTGSELEGDKAFVENDGEMEYLLDWPFERS